jgi:hypothetical protein
MPEGEPLPLQSLPANEFQSAIRALTNVRVVPDENLPGGHRIELAPFQGWGPKKEGDRVSTKKH